jgi:two-component system, LytTR family, response regulator
MSAGARFRAYLVDDEPLALKRLRRLLDETGRFEIAGSTTDPEAAIQFLAANPVDVLFLDIQMPGTNGFELLARIPEQPMVVFTTAFDQYALQAFEVNSIDYLLKPIDPRQLDRAVRKLDRLRGGGEQKTDMRAIIEQLAASLRTPRPEVPPRIASRAGDRVQFIELARITHFFAQDKLTFAAAGGRNHSVDATIAELEARLEPAGFVRIHRSILLNLAWVHEVDSWFAGRVVVRLKDDKKTELVVARDRVRVLKERLGY